MFTRWYIRTLLGIYPIAIPSSVPGIHPPPVPNEVHDTPFLDTKYLVHTVLLHAVWLLSTSLAQLMIFTPSPRDWPLLHVAAEAWPTTAKSKDSEMNEVVGRFWHVVFGVRSVIRGDATQYCAMGQTTPMQSVAE
jgi:hypothetical protein